MADLKVIQLEESTATLKVTTQYVIGLDPQKGDEAFHRSSDHAKEVDQGEDFAVLLRFLCLGELRVQKERGTPSQKVSKADVKRDLDPLTRLIASGPAAQVTLPGLSVAQTTAVLQFIQAQDPEAMESARNGAQRVLELPADAGEIRDDLYDVIAGYCQRHNLATDNTESASIQATADEPSPATSSR